MKKILNIFWWLFYAKDEREEILFGKAYRRAFTSLTLIFIGTFLAQFIIPLPWYMWDGNFIYGILFLYVVGVALVSIMAGWLPMWKEELSFKRISTPRVIMWGLVFLFAVFATLGVMSDLRNDDYTKTEWLNSYDRPDVEIELQDMELNFSTDWGREVYTFHQSVDSDYGIFYVQSGWSDNEYVELEETPDGFNDFDEKLVLETRYYQSMLNPEDYFYLVIADETIRDTGYHNRGDRDYLGNDGQYAYYIAASTDPDISWNTPSGYPSFTVR